MYRYFTKMTKLYSSYSFSYTLESVKEYIPGVDKNGDNKISWEEHKDSISFGDDDGILLMYNNLYSYDCTIKVHLQNCLYYRLVINIT